MNLNTSEQKETAANEREFSAEELIAEISAAVRDYFLCGQKTIKDGLELNFYNGQTFLLTVKESVGVPRRGGMELIET